MDGGGFYPVIRAGGIWCLLNIIEILCSTKKRAILHRCIRIVMHLRILLNSARQIRLKTKKRTTECPSLALGCFNVTPPNAPPSKRSPKIFFKCTMFKL